MLNTEPLTRQWVCDAPIVEGNTVKFNWDSGQRDGQNTSVSSLMLLLTTYTQMFILFKRCFVFFYVFIHCPVQSIRIQLFLIFESDPCKESHVLNFNNSPIDKNPDFQFQMVRLVSMKEPPSNLPEDAWGFRLLPHSHSLVCACVQHPLWHCNNCRTPQHEEKHNEMN